MPSLETFVENSLEEAETKNRLRVLKETLRKDGVYINCEGRKFISFSCNDYLGLSQHAEVKEAAVKAIEKYGAGSGASRLITGNNPLYSQLENSLARIKGAEAALVLGSGYLANIGVMPALVGKGDLILADRLVHASIIDGCMLSGAKLMRFAHNDVDACHKLLKKYRKDFQNCLIVTDHIFSMDGDIAPIDELYDLAWKNEAWLMTDDAHGLGVISNNYKNVPHIQMGTLSKAVGSYGGYVCASKKIIDYLVNNARSAIYSTGLPPSVLASSIAALKIISEDKNLCAKPLQNAQLFTSLMGMEPATSPIVPIVMGAEDKTIAASTQLQDAGFLVVAIRPPTVRKGTSRLRFAFSALHKTKDIRRLVTSCQLLKASVV